MQNSILQNELLNELYALFLKRVFPLVDKFRADHEDERKELDSLVGQGYILIRYGHYLPTLLGLKSIKLSGFEEKLVAFQKVFDFLRQSYKSNPGKDFSFTDICEALGMQSDDAKEALHYLSQATSQSIFSSSGMEMASKLVTVVMPSERILDFKTFNSYLNEQKPWKSPGIDLEDKYLTDDAIVAPGSYDLKTFEEFEDRIQKLNSDLASRIPKNLLRFSPPLFRGQIDSQWKLESTLERAINFPISASDYFRKVREIYNRLQVFTDKKWSLDFEKLGAIAGDIPFGMEAYELMVYLRHHGYPSPLIDWSESPYVAAFFAFSDTTKLSDCPDRKASIFVYIDNIGEGNAYWHGQSHIKNLGPNVVAHKRHHIQQCQYTLCLKESEGKAYYDKHQNFFDRGEVRHSILQKFSLPFSERSKVLQKLKLMNINRYTLFGSEDSLVQSLGMESFVI